MQFTETMIDNKTAYQYSLHNYQLDTYSNILNNFSFEYKMPLSDIQKLMTYELYMKVVKESNSKVRDLLENSFKLIKKRLFLSDYDVYHPIGQITI